MILKANKWQNAPALNINFVRKYESLHLLLIYWPEKTQNPVLQSLSKTVIAWIYLAKAVSIVVEVTALTQRIGRLSLSKTRLLLTKAGLLLTKTGLLLAKSFLSIVVWLGRG